jgi:hypothetical protein
MDSKNSDLSHSNKPLEVVRKAVESLRGQVDYLALSKARHLRDGLIAHAKGAEYDNKLYQDLRRKLLDSAELKSMIPSFVQNCRDLAQFWDFIPPEYRAYRERRAFLRTQFQPLINYLYWQHVAYDLNFLHVRNLPKRISERKEELLKGIESILPMNPSREALTAYAYIIASHMEWSKQLYNLSRIIVSGLFMIVWFAAISIPGMPWSYVSQDNLSNAVIAVYLVECVLLFFWYIFLNWAERWGVRPHITIVLSIVIPAVVLFVPEALVYTGDLRLPEHWLWRGAVHGSSMLSVVLCVILVSAASGSAIHALVINQQRWRNPRAHLLGELFHTLWRVTELKKDDGPDWKNLQNREKLVTCLEEAAKCLETIPKTISVLDRFSNRWNQQDQPARGRAEPR